MVKSVLNVEAVKQSRQQGKIEGKIEGKLEGKLEDLLKILAAKKFAKDEIVTKVTHEKDSERLSEWVVAAATLTDYAEFKRVVIGCE
ncbi:hypothetical protein CIG75_15935 [Tumebacillus algifaecis]|uniref:Uncharacterized protein n=1 Tax=Tumebacillus algifaecis TaxID=1214604 RepID=A0A223D4B0_9BACL|nr:hypothetical protein [Tumebacillus algifaecis]ASS76287.1 hypothetical protein CIG75_15935 [Tumebacillus algifaecis]